MSPSKLTYTDDGELSIDNNVSERTVKMQAIGRRNWLFVAKRLKRFIESIEHYRLDWYATRVCILVRRRGAVEYMYAVLAKNPILREYKLFEKFLASSYEKVHAELTTELQFCERSPTP